MLEQIIKHKKDWLDQLNSRSTIDDMAKSVRNMRPARGLRTNLTKDNKLALIAEIKRRSPSRGILNNTIEVDRFVRLYEEAGASAVSILTEDQFFSGSIDDLKMARENTSLPILRKDFIIEESQIWESRAIGADAVLLIAAILSDNQLYDLHALAREIGLETIIEIHSKEELDRAWRLKPEIIGINNRNLKTFQVSLNTVENLYPLIPCNAICISESGIKTRDDMLRVQECGVDAVLIGEGIVTSEDPFGKIRELLGESE
ncbi:MAG: indole-3-glycerol phosphate synthase TrpC [candidate division Zixibacteria bacterium]